MVASFFITFLITTIEPADDKAIIQFIPEGCG